MRLTKTDMARVIVQALFNLKDLPPADHPAVVKKAMRNQTCSLKRQHKLAIDVLAGVRHVTLPASEAPPGEGWSLVASNVETNLWKRTNAPTATDAETITRNMESS